MPILSFTKVLQKREGPPPHWGRTGFDGDVETEVAGRGAAGLVKSGTIVIGNDYEYAYAA